MKWHHKKYAVFVFLVLNFLLISTVAMDAQVYINEFLASNITVNTDELFSDYSDWIELFNESDQEIDMTGYSLSDDIIYHGRWLFPEGTTIKAKGFLLVWADGKNIRLHTNFKLNSSGEQVCLTDPFGEIMDSLSYGEQAADVSYGRNPDNWNEWLYFSTPSPNAVNNTRSHTGIVGKPRCSLPGGFYNGPKSITFLSDLPGSFMRYTLDGSEPSMNSAVYSGPIDVNSTTIIRIKGYCQGFIPSKTVTNTYFVDEGDFMLPVISISAAPADLWDDDIGIYVEGNADCDCGMNLTGNYCCLDWEKPIGIEFYETDGTQAFSVNAGLKIFGSGSRKRIPQRSLSIFARGRYGVSEIDYQLFPDKPINEYTSFILRSSAHDWIKTMFRDALIQYLSVGYMDLDIQAYRPAIVFINGEYWGIHNIREKLNEDYLASNHGVDPDNVDILERDSWIVEGDNIAYEQFLDFVSTHDMTVAENYIYAKGKIDVDEYIDYLILHIFSAKSDWPSNNIKFWRPRKEDGIWRWMAYDMDFGFGLDTERFHMGTYDHNMMELVTDPNGDTWNNPPWSTLLIRKMLENPEFRDDFIQRFSNHLNTTFETQRVLDLIECFKARIEPEIPRHIDRWGGTYALELGYVFESLDEWDDNIEVMREFARKRPDIMREHLMGVFGLSETVDLTVTRSDKNGGFVKINNIPVMDSCFTGTYFKDIPVTLKALEKYGYAFAGWTVTGNITETTTLISKGSSWKYLDDGSNQGTAWTAIDFDDSGWKSGVAQLGYGDGDENTVLSFGPDEDNKYITTYFRHRFQMEETSSFKKLVFDLLRDDGAVIYLNGHEIIRSNIPEGYVDYQTFAELSVPAVSENIYLRRETLTEYLVEGINVLAVEIHQQNLTSSDISFDLELSAVGTRSDEILTVNDAEIILDMDGDYSVNAEFQALPQTLLINEFMADNTKAFSDEYGEFDDWIEIYNAGDTAVDLGGYYLTDDLNNPTLWQIPSGYQNLTTIPAGETLLLWADNDTDQGPLHVGFRLSADGEQIGLSLNGMDFIDSLSFTGQSEDISYGRYPDGEKIWQSFAISSPGEMNQVTGMNRTVMPGNVVLVYPNPTSSLINFSIQTADICLVNISIMNVLGNMIYQENYNVNHKIIVEFDLSSYATGIYFVIFKFENELITRKILYNR